MPLVREDTAVEDTVPQTVSAVVAPSSIVKQLYPDNEPPPLTELAVKVKEVAEEVMGEARDVSNTAVADGSEAPSLISSAFGAGTKSFLCIRLPLKSAHKNLCDIHKRAEVVLAHCKIAKDLSLQTRQRLKLKMLRLSEGFFSYYYYIKSYNACGIKLFLTAGFFCLFLVCL